MVPVVDDDPAGDVMSLRARKKRLVRDAIVHAALELFASDGFDATSVQAIAARAGVSAATVARYFPAKESLLFPERDERVATLRAAILAHAHHEDPIEAVVAGFLAQPPMTDDDRYRLLRVRQAIARSSVLRGRALGLLDAWRDGIADALHTGWKLDVHDARVIATAVVAILDDVSARWAAEGGRSDLQAAGQRAVAVLRSARVASP